VGAAATSQKGGKGGRPVVGVDGNWQCPLCENVNFGTREACNRCQTPRPEEEAAATLTGHAEAEEATGEWTWACPACGGVNSVEQPECSLCAAPMPTGQDGIKSQVTGGTKRKSVVPAPALGAGWQPQAFGDGRGPAGGPIAGMDGNWACAHCHNVNFAHRDVCNRCQAPRPFEGPSHGKGGRGPGGKSGAPVAGVDGNWACALCGNVNYSTREACHKCGSPREDSPAPPGGGAKAGAPVAGVGDNVNFAQRESCNRCQAPRQEQPGGALLAPAVQKGAGRGPPVDGVDGNWRCQQCGNVNFGTRDACNRCQALRPLETRKGSGKGPPVAGVDGNWLCSGCSNVNYQVRDVCNRCHAPKPSGADIAEDTGAVSAQPAQEDEEDEGQPAKRPRALPGSN